MTAIPQPFSSREISTHVTDPLQQVVTRQWYVDAAVAILKLLIVTMIALFAVAMLLGYFPDLWMSARMSLAIFAWVIVIVATVRLITPTLRRWSIGRAATHVEQTRPELHERLSSAIELAAESDPVFQGSQALIEHLFNQAENDAASLTPKDAVPVDRVILWAILFAPVLLTSVALVSIPTTSHIALSGLYRAIMPWKTSLPAMLTQISVTPGDVVLVQGDSIDVAAKLRFENSSDHAMLIRKFENGQQLTDSMDHSGPHDFRLHLDNVLQNFSYMVSTGPGSSTWFTATIHPRPQITGLQIRCDYPAYTALPATVVNSEDGSINALVGTRVTLNVRTALPVVADKSGVAIDGGPSTDLKLVDSAYQAQFTVVRSGQYKINLANEFGLTNINEQPRIIVAKEDEIPRIVIRSPEARVTVGPNDVVPIKYTATDDFAVAKIEAIVQVDDQAARTVPVVFKSDDKRNVTGPDFPISIAEVLNNSGSANGRVITYQLKVTDNRDPEPQSSLSNKQTLMVEHFGDQTFANHEDRRLEHELMQAIDKAMGQLNEAQQRLQPTRDADPNQPLDTWRKQQLNQAAAQLPKTSQQLAKAADDAKNSPLEDVAKKVGDIATKPIEAAAEDVAKANLNSDNPEDRKKATTKAIAEITQARDALQKLQADRAVDKAVQQAEAAHDLADAAQKQQEAADLMKPGDQQPTQQSRQQQRQAMRDQEQANQALQKALQTDEPLRDPQAQETAQKLQDLIHKVGEIQKQQDAQSQQNQKQQTAADVQLKANELARQQEALNRDIQKSAEQNRNPLQKAGANPPSQAQQQNIVKALNRNDLQPAHDQMRQAANQLHQEAQQLQSLAKSNDLHPGDHEQEELNKDQQTADAAQKQKREADHAADDLKQAAQQNEVPQDDNTAVANAKHVAKQLQKQAAELDPRNDDAKQLADAAERDAKAAEHAADVAAKAADPKEAQKDLNDAAKDMNNAGQELADAAKENAAARKAEMVKAQQKDADDAAKVAEHQAQQQDAIAQAVAARQRDMARAQNPTPPEQLAQQQNQIADQTRDAKQKADELGQQAHKANNPDVAARADQAKADLSDAQHHAAEAAKAQQHAAQAKQDAANAQDAAEAKAAEQNADHALAQAATDQQQAQAALAKAEHELRDMPTADAQADSATPTQQAAQAAQEAAQAQRDASQQNADAAQQAAKALAKAALAMAKATPGMQPGEPDNANDPGQQSATTPHRSAESSEGITHSAVAVTVPGSVLDLGITADQWANLPPLQQKDLLNAAQQSGPPGYRKMMKEYFAKIAKMQE
jgi:hypothetical protein